MAQSFTDLVMWQEAKVLTLLLYKYFKPRKDFSFKDQLQRASISIMNNVAEGHGRRSDKTFHYFLSISKGSSTEVGSMLLLSVELGYLDASKQKELLEINTKIQKLLSGLMAKLSASSL